MKKGHLLFVKHILESIENIEDFSKGITRDEFRRNRLKQSAIIRELEIIGEAVKNTPLDFKKNYPEIEWIKIAGMRDKLIHQYFGVDLDLTFDVIKIELPKLKENIKKILKNKK